MTNDSTAPIEIFEGSVGNAPRNDDTIYLVATNSNRVSLSTTPVTIMDTMIPPNALGLGGVIDISFRASGFSHDDYTRYIRLTAMLGDTTVINDCNILYLAPGYWVAYWNYTVFRVYSNDGTLNTQYAALVNADTVAACHGTASEDGTAPIRLRITARTTSGNMRYPLIYPIVVMGVH